MEERSLCIKTEEVLRYMGHRGPADPELLALVDTARALVLEAAEPRWLFDITPLAKKGGAFCLAQWEIALPGKSAGQLLAGCDRAVVMCATLSLGTDRLLRQLQLEDMALAFAADCCATAGVEALCDLAQGQIASHYPDWGFTRRFSPGYGDLPLELQGPLLGALESQKRIGLWANDHHLLIPRKSVTAVIGVGCWASLEAPEGAAVHCGTCPLCKTCYYRKHTL